MCQDMSPVEKAIQFHGHICPGLLIGVRAAELALQQLGARPDYDEELLAIVENDSCSVDAIQAILGCTFGKGNLIFKDYGKQVFTIASRDKKQALRIASRHGVMKGKNFDRFRELSRMSGRTPEQERELDDLQLQLFEEVMARPVDELFDYREVSIEWPDKARLHKTVACAICGEGVSEHRTVDTERGRVCLPCSKEV